MRAQLSISHEFHVVNRLTPRANDISYINLAYSKSTE